MHMSMHTRPMMGRACPSSQTLPRLDSARCRPSAYPMGSTAVRPPSGPKLAVQP